MAGMLAIALCLGAELCIVMMDCNSGWQQVVHARQQLLPGKTIAGAPTPAIPKPGPQGPGFLCGKILSPLRPPFLGVSPLARYKINYVDQRSKPDVVRCEGKPSSSKTKCNAATGTR
jgi:hypothetical protein